MNWKSPDNYPRWIPFYVLFFLFKCYNIYHCIHLGIYFNKWLLTPPTIMILYQSYEVLFPFQKVATERGGEGVVLSESQFYQKAICKFVLYRGEPFLFLWEPLIYSVGAELKFETPSGKAKKKKKRNKEKKGKPHFSFLARGGIHLIHNIKVALNHVCSQPGLRFQYVTGDESSPRFFVEISFPQEYRSTMNVLHIRLILFFIRASRKKIYYFLSIVYNNFP